MKNRKISKRTLLLAVAAILLFTVGGFAAAQAPGVVSEDYRAEFELDHIAVNLLENGKPLDGNLLGDYGYSKDGGKYANLVPGKTYKEEIAAKNATDVDQYIRITVHKYWVDKNGNRDTSKNPDLIRLTYNGSGYNDGAWQLNKDESTAERSVYYYSNALKGNETAKPVLNQLQIDDSIVPRKVLDDDGNPVDGVTVKTDEDGVTTYTYEYDGYRACVEADVQALQPHNINDAIKSVWGVQNVTAAGGKLTVK